MLKKTVGNWVDGDRFFDRHDDLLVLRDAVLDGTNLLLTGQRRMGKTSLVRESLRRLKAEDGIRHSLSIWKMLADRPTPS